MSTKLIREEILQQKYDKLESAYQLLESKYRRLEETKTSSLSSSDLTFFWKAILDQNCYAVEVLDLEGRVLEMNAEAERIFDCKKKDFISLRLPLLDSPQCPEEIREAFRKGEAVSSVFHFEFPPSVDFKDRLPYSETTSNHRLYFRGLPIRNVLGEVYRYVALLSVETEQVKLKSELRTARKLISDNNLHTRMLLDSLDEAVIYISNNAKILDVNKKYEQLLNCDRMRIRVFQQGLDQQPVMTLSMQNAVKEGAFFQTSFWFQPCLSDPMHGAIVEEHTAGSIYLQYRGLPIVDEKKRCIGYLGLFNDRTSERLMLEELQLAKDKADLANRMKSTFLANMSHEIRTPLNSIVGFSGLLAEMLEKDPEAKEYNKMIRDNNALLLRLISDVLDFAKLESGSMQFIKEEFSFSGMMREIHTALQPKAHQHQHQLIRLPNDDHYIVKLDKTRVMQVIINFVNNAIKYTPRGGHITMMAYKDKDGIKVEVTDNGIGIAPENQDKVFERFEKLDTFAQGNGLGLSISKVITELQGGKIGFSSELDKGSVFWAWFPTSTVSIESSLC